MASFKSVLGFRPVPVTILTLITYITLFSALLWVDRRPPKVACRSELDHWGVSVDEAWRDLQVLTREFHPYNSRQNDNVRQFLLDRIREILSDNGVQGFNDDMAAEDTARYGGLVELIDDGVGSTPGSNVTFAGSAQGNITVCLPFSGHSQNPHLRAFQLIAKSHDRSTLKERISFFISTVIAQQHWTCLPFLLARTTTVSLQVMVCLRSFIPSALAVTAHPSP